MVKTNCSKCSTCAKKLLAHKVNITCSLCYSSYHPKCANLTRGDAIYIITAKVSWTCYACVTDMLPIGLLQPNAESLNLNSNLMKTLISDPGKLCHSCNKVLGQHHKTCVWCDNLCHTRCISGELGCKACAADSIPGYNCYAWELNSNRYANNTLKYNPFDDHPNFVGDDNDILAEIVAWEQASSCLNSCKYTELKNVSNQSQTLILSLNIRSLRKNIIALRDDIGSYKKFSILCFNETSCDPETLPFGESELELDGFHSPIVQRPARDSNKGGGLIVYVNNNFCQNAGNVVKLEHLSSRGTSISTGEWLFVKISGSTFGKDIIIGNTYRSPSENPENYIEKMQTNLESINEKYKNKTVVLCGDTNLDLLQYENNANVQKLNEITTSNGFLPVISRPTRVTDHSATLIDHIYTNSLDTLISTGVITIDISDHMGTFIKLGAQHNYLKNPNNFNKNNAAEDIDTESFEYRKFSDENLKKFEEFVQNEPWDELIALNLETEAFYSKFIDRYLMKYMTLHFH